MSNDQNRSVPKIVALEVLEKNGVDVQRLIELIRKGVGAEFTTYYYYTILRMHCTGLEGEGIKEIVEDARIEDRNHFEAMTPRLYELGGSLPRDIREFADQAGHSFGLYPKHNPVYLLFQVSFCFFLIHRLLY